MEIRTGVALDKAFKFAKSASGERNIPLVYFSILPNFLLLMLIFMGNACAAPSQSSSSQNILPSTLIPYAPIKRPENTSERGDPAMFFLPVPHPKLGVLIAYGNILSPGANWTIVDFGTQSITRITTTLKSRSDGERYTAITGKAVRHLTVREVNKIITQANAVWNPKENLRSPTSFATDVTCDVLLFDGDDVLDNRGTLCPDGQLVTVIEANKTPNIDSP